MADLKIRPLEDRVVVEPLEAEEKTAGGILLPDTAKEKPQRGRVLAVGAGQQLLAGLVGVEELLRHIRERSGMFGEEEEF